MVTLVRQRPLLAPTVLFVSGTAALIAAGAIPQNHVVLLAWLIVALLAFAALDSRGGIRRFVVDWMPFMLIALVYDMLRGAAGRTFAVHFLPQIQFDRWIGAGQTPTVTLQRWLWHGHLTWFDVISWLVYLSHFVATPVLALALWRFSRSRFRILAANVSLLAFLALATYWLFPAAPPWLASRHHLIAPITRLIPAFWASLPMHWAGGIFLHVYHLVEHGYRYANPTAAVPSLHAAFSLLVAITLWPMVARRSRPLLLAYPLAMGFTVVYTGEHYVADVLLGWLYATGSVLAVAAVRRGLSLAASNRAEAWTVDGSGGILAIPMARIPGRLFRRGPSSPEYMHSSRTGDGWTQTQRRDDGAPDEQGPRHPVTSRRTGTGVEA